MELTITKSKFEKIKQKALIIDVRDNWEHQELRKLPNSFNIPLLELISNPENYIKDKNQLIVTYCNYGNRSGQAAKILREKSYLRVFVLEEGVEDYFSENN